MKFFLMLLIGSNLIADPTTDHCELALSKVAADYTKLTADDSWRADFTHRLSNGTTIATDSARENQIRGTIQNQLGVIIGWPDTPPMYVIPEKGANYGLTEGWQEKKPIVAQVSGDAVKDGKFRATIMLPVSGHTGVSNARQWSTTDTYSLVHVDSSGNRTFLVKDAPSKALVTAQEVEIPLEKDKMVQVLYYRSGSGGPSGYVGGRTLHLTWR